MKKILLSFIIIISLSSFNELRAEKYNVIASTKHPYTQNYTISLVVDGNCMFNTCTIYKVYQYTPYGLVEISYTPDFYNTGWYYVHVGYETYYFNF